jgi:hypothetical protein
MFKKLLLLIGAISLCLSVGITNALPAATSNQKDITLLYVLHAEKGQIVKTQDNQFQLKLYDVSDDITYFSDRPNRIVGDVTIKQFTNRWIVGDNSFKVNNPNAALVGVLDMVQSGSRKSKDRFIVLSNPSYDADKDTLSFTIKSINKDKLSVEKFKNISLFIDPSLCGSWCH